MIDLNFNSYIRLYSVFIYFMNHTKTIALVNNILYTARKDSFPGSSVGKCDEATGFILRGQIPCLHPSTWFNSWLWLKFHDSMLVVAKGVLIDWSEIYSAVADCRKKEGGQGRLCRRLYHRWVSHSLARPMFQVALSKQFLFLLLLTCLFSLSVSENKPAISKKKLWFF